MTQPDDNLDDLLRDHFAAELGPMRGQARRAFGREVIGPMRRRLRWRAAGAVARRARQLLPLATTMAACAALGYAVPRWWTGPTATQTVAESMTPTDKSTGPVSNVFGSPALADYEQTRFESHEDRGPGLLPDGTPGRRVSRTRVEAAHYVDPDTKARTELYFLAPESDGVYSAARQ